MKTLTIINLKEIIDKQMEINWYEERFDDLVNMKDWFIKFTTTDEKEEEFKKWLKNYLKPFIVKERLDKEVWYFILNYWLKNGYNNV